MAHSIVMSNCQQTCRVLPTEISGPARSVSPAAPQAWDPEDAGEPACRRGVLSPSATARVFGQVFELFLERSIIRYSVIL